MGALVGGGIATLLSIMVLSRAIADNPLYRIAQYLLVGVALGLAGAVVVNQTLVPSLVQAAAGQAPPRTLIVLAIVAVLVVLLATRFGRQRLSALADLPLAVLFGVGAALVLVGAARGTITPMLLDTIALRRLQTEDSAALLGTVILIVTVVITLLSFTYAQRREQASGAAQGVRTIGRGLILAAFGVFLAAAVTTYITALVTQLQAIADWIALLLNQF